MIGASGMHVLLLLRCRRHVMLLGRSTFLRGRRGLRAIGATVETDAGRVVDDDGLVIDVGDVHFRADVDDGLVVEERTATPLATFKSHAAISEAVVHAAVEADVRTPIAIIENVYAV